ncbi:hypothetical protein GUJ93_ZPchr0012g19377 [Zizania palustris]|uniref:Uncharacterized protein n=1 Tax=Zizania palustris TaxID=103762 RepID=A0A8J5WVC7_ZIZPA|nr:hypothetical protein GUJ93_ZPchr0012g19377 [Zizania palustris]
MPVKGRKRRRNHLKDQAQTKQNKPQQLPWLYLNLLPKLTSISSNLHKLMVTQQLEDRFTISLFQLLLCNQTRSTCIRTCPRCLFVHHRISRYIRQCVPILILVVQRTSKGICYMSLENLAWMNSVNLSRDLMTLLLFCSSGIVGLICPISAQSHLHTLLVTSFRSL